MNIVTQHSLNVLKTKDMQLALFGRHGENLLQGKLHAVFVSIPNKDSKQWRNWNLNSLSSISRQGLKWRDWPTNSATKPSTYSLSLMQSVLEPEASKILINEAGEKSSSSWWEQMGIPINKHWAEFIEEELEDPTGVRNTTRPRPQN